uniref:Kinesinlike protein putative n=1 Tax=Albugo laibachii Nc14 TaxID=890382 RepID=F0W805_9STRA|nr:kinesinlike protein putative [Albugo laibachii Nc14]|eukprot:CCA17258.1 kinesinlike protein putative [Albugo laibachii Nc14]
MPSSTSDTQETPSSIQLFCRLRPQNALEREVGASSCSTVVDNRGVFIRSAHCEVDDLRCTFDRIFDVDATQEQVYENSAKPLVNDFIQGSNCTIFAYGQTGSGKTHTISGCMDASSCTKRMVNPSGGIIPRLIRDLYREKERYQADTNRIEFKASFVEIYLEQIRDLLHGAEKISRSSAASIGSQRNNGGLLRIRECSQRGIFISDMTELVAPDADSMIEYVRLGTQQRAVTSTKMNKDSSRSHSVFTITMTHFRTMVDGSRVKLKSCTMYIVDLAGSELVNKSNVSGKVLQEAISINKSLSALSNVIKALAEGKKHVPYRDSKLTRILQDSLSGRAKIALILTASCSTYNLSETLSTLRFGLRAKELKNVQVSSPLENDEMSKEDMMELYLQAMEAVSAGKREIEALKHQLEAQRSSPVFSDDESGCESLEGDSRQPERLDEGQWIPTKVDGAQTMSYSQLLERVQRYERNAKMDRGNDELNDLKMRLEEITLSLLSVEPPSFQLDAGPTLLYPTLTLGKLLQQSDWREVLSRGEHNIIEIHCASTPTDSLLIAEAFSHCPELHRNNDLDHDTDENTSICVHRVRSEERGIQICELKHKLQSLAQVYLQRDQPHSSLSAENTTLKKRVEELEMLLQALLNQAEVDEQAIESRLAEQGNHMPCLQSSLQQYQTLFRSQITKYQDKYRLLREELFVYKNDTSIHANNSSVRRLSLDSQDEAEDEEIGMHPQECGAIYYKGADGMLVKGGTLPNLQIHAPIVASADAMQVKKWQLGEIR